MKTAMNTFLRPALVLFFVLTLVTGLAYPLVVTSFAKAIFPVQASGSLIFREGQAVGSTLIGQQFVDPGHFWGRPSATAPMPYNASASSGSNLGPLKPALIDSIKGRIEALRSADPGNKAPVPVDLVTSSASGLDPHISPAAARYQVARVAKTRGLAADMVQNLVDSPTEEPLLNFIGERQINVLKLNLALATLRPPTR